MAASKEMVNQMLAAASRAKLDVVGMNVEPKALIDCFTHVYRRKSDEVATSCFVDIGCSASRAVIARGQEMLFGRVIPIGGDQFSRAVAESLKITHQDAKILRVKLCAQQSPEDAKATIQPERAVVAAAPAASATSATDPTGDNSFALLDSAMRKATPAPTPAPAPLPVAAPIEANNDGIDPVDATEAQRVNQACREPLRRLVEELNMCRRYYESTFPEKPIDRLIFVGGEARQRQLCQQVAREMGLAAQVGDPLVRIGRISEIGIESGIDRRQPQPAWAVAIGLSMGPRSAATPVAVAAAEDQTHGEPQTQQNTRG